MTPQEKKAYNKTYYATHKDYWQKYKVGRGNSQIESWYKKRYGDKGKEMQTFYKQAQSLMTNSKEMQNKANEIRKIMRDFEGKTDYISIKKRNKLLKNLGVDVTAQKPYKAATNYEHQARNLKISADKFNKQASDTKKSMDSLSGDIVRSNRQYQIANYPRSAYIRPEKTSTKIKRVVKQNIVNRGKKFVDSWLIGAGLR